jgi:hypothetical protein
MNRRAFCRFAVTGIGFMAIAGRSLAAAARRENATAPILAVIYDERYAEAREFAATLGRGGAIEFPIRGSSACHWYGELAALLGRHRGRVAGLSTYADLLIARSRGRELGLKPVFEGMHDARGTKLVAHRYRMSGAADLARKLARKPALQPSELGQFLNRIDGKGNEDWRTVEAAGPRSLDHPGFLTTWLLGPRALR